MKHFIFLLFILKASFLIGQKEIVLSFQKEGLDFDNIHRLGSKGFIVSFSSKAKKGIINHKKIWYSNDAKIIKELSFSITDAKYNSYFVYSNDSYIIERYYNKSGADCFIVTDISEFKENIIKPELPKGFQTDNICAVNDKLFLSGSTSSGIYVRHFLVIDINTGKTVKTKNMIGDIPQSSLFVKSIIKAKGTDEAYILLEQFKTMKETSYFAKINESGAVLSSFNLTEITKYNSSFLSVLKVNSNTSMLSGSYYKKSNLRSDGVFISELENDKINYSNFYKLDNTLKLTKETSTENNDEEVKVTKADKKDNALSKFKNNKIYAHELIATKSGYYFAGEVYYETDKTLSDGTTVFTGNQFTHGIIVKFSLSGELQWYSTFEMVPHIKMNKGLYNIGLKLHDDESIEVFYNSNKKLHSKKYDHNGKLLSEKNTNEVIQNVIIHLFENKFLCYSIIADKGISHTLNFQVIDVP
jgi:hypothetical protein